MYFVFELVILEEDQAKDYSKS